MSTLRKTRLTKTDEDTLNRIAAQERMVMRFSDEQRIQIGRLTRAGGFTTSGGSSTCDETIYTLAAAALRVFGLDPIAEEAFDRIAAVVFGTENDGGRELTRGSKILEACDGGHEAAEAWTLAHRAAERVAALKGRVTAQVST